MSVPHHMRIWSGLLGFRFRSLQNWRSFSFGVSADPAECQYQVAAPRQGRQPQVRNANGGIPVGIAEARTVTRVIPA
jgi:hypothetical protein